MDPGTVGWLGTLSTRRIIDLHGSGQGKGRYLIGHTSIRRLGTESAGPPKYRNQFLPTATIGSIFAVIHICRPGGTRTVSSRVLLDTAPPRGPPSPDSQEPVEVSRAVEATHLVPSGQHSSALDETGCLGVLVPSSERLHREGFASERTVLVRARPGVSSILGG